MGQNFSKLGIANKALLKIGAKRLSSLDDGSPNSVIVEDIYDQCRQEALSEHPFVFATQIVALASLTLSTAIPTTDMTWYAYALPTDYISIYKLLPNCRFLIRKLSSPYVSSGTLALLSDNNNLTGIEYVYDNDNPPDYSAKFYEALSCKLAYEMCFKISEAAQWATAMKGAYDKAILSAIASDSNQSTPDAPIADEWFAARLLGSAPLVGLGPDNNNVGYYYPGDY